MPDARALRRYFVALAALLASLVFPAWSFLIGPQPPSPGAVVEFFNTQVNRYFYTVSQDEAKAIDAGAAGPGWIRTGVNFGAFASVDASRFNGAACDSAFTPCVPVSRFYARTSNSHFFTA